MQCIFKHNINDISKKVLQNDKPCNIFFLANYFIVDTYNCLIIRKIWSRLVYSLFFVLIIFILYCLHCCLFSRSKSYVSSLSVYVLFEFFLVFYFSFYFKLFNLLRVIGLVDYIVFIDDNSFVVRNIYDYYIFIVIDMIFYIFDLKVAYFYFFKDFNMS